MEIEVRQWLDTYVARIKDAFGDRLLYAGCNGSQARGEATQNSDIDVNIVLDRLSEGDLIKYRALARAVPGKRKICGFICGKAEMQAWPRHELFQFTQGSITLFGTLAGMVEPPLEGDIWENILNTASGIYHLACHSFIYSGDLAQAAEGLLDAYKFAFFALQEWVYVAKKKYVPTKKELIAELNGENKAILEICMNWDNQKTDREKTPEKYFFALIGWAASMMRNAAEKRN
jgi:hypothetical protein